MQNMYQIELWAECRNSPCAFCNLGLGITALERNLDPRRIFSPEEKKVLITKAINHLQEVDAACLGTVIVKGGEVFNKYDDLYLEEFKVFLNLLATLVIAGSIKKIFFVTALKYPYKDSLLEASINHFKTLGDSYNFSPLRVLTVGTSWDGRYRFVGQDRSHWKTNINLLKEQGIDVHITSILTQQFIEDYNRCGFGYPSVRKLVARNAFDLILPTGKGSLSLQKFFPKRNDFKKFCCTIIQKEPELFDRLVDPAKTRASHIYFAARGKVIVRDLSLEVRNDKNSELLPCGHSKDLSFYRDSDECSMCDIIKIKKATS